MPNFLKLEYLFQERESLEFWKDLVTFWNEKWDFFSFPAKEKSRKVKEMV